MKLFTPKVNLIIRIIATACFLALVITSWNKEAFDRFMSRACFLASLFVLLIDIYDYRKTGKS